MATGPGGSSETGLVSPFQSSEAPIQTPMTPSGQARARGQRKATAVSAHTPRPPRATMVRSEAPMLRRPLIALVREELKD